MLKGLIYQENKHLYIHPPSEHLIYKVDIDRTEGKMVMQ